MTIGTPTNNVPNAGADIVTPLAIPSAGTITVAAGELIVVPFARYSPTSDPIVVGDISTSGTATLGAWSLDNPRNGTTDGGSSYAATGHFSAIVTGGGTLAVSIGGNPATTYAHGGLLSFPGNWDGSRLETSAGPGAVGTGSVNVATDSMTSAGIGLFVGVAQVNTGLSSLGASSNATDIYRALNPDTGASAYRISTGALTYAFSWAANTAAVFNASGVVYKEAGGDTTAPVLTIATGSATGSSTATVGATTDEGNGTLYAVVTTSATQPSVAQIKAGQDHTGAAAAWSGSQAISTTGAKTLNATGLSVTTAYYAHLVHTDAAANDSNRISSATFTTFQRAAPISDIAAGNWTPSSGSDLFAMIDEQTPSDADYISTSTPGDYCEFALTVLTDPTTGLNHIPAYRIWGDGVSGMEVTVRQGTTVIATFTHDPAPGTPTTFTQTLSGVEADSITNYAALRLRFTEI